MTISSILLKLINSNRPKNIRESLLGKGGDDSLLGVPPCGVTGCVHKRSRKEAIEVDLQEYRDILNREVEGLPWRSSG